jgi:uncharacterized protein (TIGR01777 family)
MKILITGSHGMIGSAVTPYLVACGHRVSRLVRSTPGPGEVWWDPDKAKIDSPNIEGFGGIVHLATMPWPMRWTAKVKEKIRANHVGTNRLLAESLAGCAHKPHVLICASGMGFYASSGNDVLTENCPAGTSFLARLQQDGEVATAPASKAGIRVVHLRIPPVIGGPTLQRAAFQAGNGQQWMSWIGRDELAFIVEFALTTKSLSGPVNAVSPHPIRNAEFAMISSKVLGHKAGFGIPAFMARLVMGEMGEEFLLASRRIQPAKLLAAGYRFRFPTLANALRHEKDRQNAVSALNVVDNMPAIPERRKESHS